MRATITVYGPRGSEKTRWLGQLKGALMSTTPFEAVEVILHESHKTVFGSIGAMLFDEFTVPAADAEGSVGVAGDRETWSIVPTSGGTFHVHCGMRKVGGFVDEAEAELFVAIKTLSPVARRAVDAIVGGEELRFEGNRIVAATERPANPKGGGGEIAEGAGAIPRGIYWCNVGGNFYDAITHHGQGAQFYRTWVARRQEFPQSEDLTLSFASGGRKLSAAEAPAIHDGWPTPMVPKAEREALRRELDVACRDAAALRKERDEARRERDILKARLVNVITYLNGFKNLNDALRDVEILDGAS